MKESAGNRCAVAPWLLLAVVLPVGAVHGPAAPVSLAVEASGRLPGFDAADVPRYLSGQMSTARLGDWEFEPAAPSASPAPNRMKWEFTLHLRAAGGVRHLHRENRWFHARRLVGIKVTLFLDGRYRAAVCGEARVRGGPNDRELAASVRKLARSLMADPARCPCQEGRAAARRDPLPGDPPSSGGAEDRPQSLRDRDLASGEWGGLRARLEDRGASIGIEWVAHGFGDFRGGIERGAVASSTLDVDLSLDMQTLFGVRGGEFYIDFEDHSGRDPSASLVGDAQVFDKLNFTPYFQIFELWYEQRLFDDVLRLKIGKVDANTEFSVIDNGLRFLNSSSQVTPTLFLFPTTPDPMPSVNLFYTPKQPYYASFGVYDSNRSDRFLFFTGHPEAIQPTRRGKFLIGETGLVWDRLPGFKADGNLRLGFWGHTGTFTRLDGGTQHGTEGQYVIFDQTLWKPAPLNSSDKRGLRLFLEYGCTDPAVSLIDRHFGGGIAWTGLVPGRRQDIAGFTPQYAHFSPGAGLAHGYELAFETFDRVQFAPWANVQPDVQYILHPGGQYPSAVVGTLRLEVIF